MNAQDEIQLQYSRTSYNSPSGNRPFASNKSSAGLSANLRKSVDDPDDMDSDGSQNESEGIQS